MLMHRRHAYRRAKAVLHNRAGSTGGRRHKYHNEAKGLTLSFSSSVWVPACPSPPVCHCASPPASHSAETDTNGRHETESRVSAVQPCNWRLPGTSPGLALTLAFWLRRPGCRRGCRRGRKGCRRQRRRGFRR